MTSTDNVAGKTAPPHPARSPPPSVTGTPIAALVHGYATATGWAAAALTGIALAAIALIRPNLARPGHHLPDNKE